MSPLLCKGKERAQNLLGNVLGKSSGLVSKTEWLKIYRWSNWKKPKYKSNLRIVTRVVSSQNLASYCWQLASDTVRCWFDFVRSHFWRQELGRAQSINTPTLGELSFKLLNEHCQCLTGTINTNTYKDWGQGVAWNNYRKFDKEVKQRVYTTNCAVLE